ncbi:MAG: 7-carboxy-7-deazaguanine synthase QueE [Planctomycetes bacterium]|nr:7-carboxy-7-deazaguanine synthase QueE [Planctomycetota bacterium]MBU1518290.1 7-carboxy-7-deazaguanine synthase QueE [Planctomycetota bacterium]MBU2458164.1 7-carboxy-7-deazaguanine synthase QueE [Planctomycetota bacterium]MBU2596632.1 7-carboxy-7-deazaguanine synthase QueE [Planctomycetota bacterium]
MQNTEIQISEIFYSIQGEGLLAGRASVFIRLAGCPLRCNYCDTKYALDARAGTKMSIDEIMKKVMKHSPKYAVITGGEPMISPHISLLCEKMKENNIHITIETAGIKFVSGLACDLMSISPKTSNACDGQQDKDKYLKIDQLKGLVGNYDYQLKFVIEKIEDVAEVHQIVDYLKDIDRSKVLLMPQAGDVSEYIKKSPLIVELCKANGFVFSPRLQLVFGETRPAE